MEVIKSMPKPKKNIKENQISLIIQVTFGGRTILFTGDAEGEGLWRLFHRSISLKPFMWLCPTLKKDIQEQLNELEKAVKLGESSNFSDVLCERYWDLYDVIAKQCGLSNTSTLYEYIADENGWNVSTDVKEQRKMLMQHLVDVLRIRCAINLSDVIVLPPHGSNAEASLNFLGYFSSLKKSIPLFAY